MASLSPLEADNAVRRCSLVSHFSSPNNIQANVPSPDAGLSHLVTPKRPGGPLRRHFKPRLEISGELRHFCDGLVTDLITGVPFEGECPLSHRLDPEVLDLSGHKVRKGCALMRLSLSEVRSLRCMNFRDMLPVSATEQPQNCLILPDQSGFVKLGFRTWARCMAYKMRVWSEFSADKDRAQKGLPTGDCLFFVSYDGYSLTVDGGAYLRRREVDLLALRDRAFTEVVRECQLSFYQTARLPRRSFVLEDRSKEGVLVVLDENRGVLWKRISGSLTQLLSEWCLYRDGEFGDMGQDSPAFLFPGGDGHFLTADPLDGRIFADMKMPNDDDFDLGTDRRCPKRALDGDHGGNGWAVNQKPSKSKASGATGFTNYRPSKKSSE